MTIIPLALIFTAALYLIQSERHRPMGTGLMLVCAALSLLMPPV